MKRQSLAEAILAAALDAGSLLPKADCPRCTYREPKQGGHCYMFRDKPGDYCGQFTAEREVKA